MVKDLYIIGAGDFGREVLAIARDIEKTQTKWKIKGFLDSNLNALDGIETDGYNICDTVENHNISEGCVYICAIANVDVKKKICTSYISKGAEFINLIHPTARVGYTSKIGIGFIAPQYSLVTENVTIGNFVTLNAFSGIGHDAVIEDFCTISSHCDIMGHVTIKESVFLGSGAAICPGVIIGEHVRIGVGSVVLKNVKPNKTVFGNPAKEIF